MQKIKFNMAEVQELKMVIREMSKKDLSSLYEIKLIGPFGQRLTFGIIDKLCGNFVANFEIWKFTNLMTVGSTTFQTTNHLFLISNISNFLVKLDEYLENYYKGE